MVTSACEEINIREPAKMRREKQAKTQNSLFSGLKIQRRKCRNL